MLNSAHEKLVSSTRASQPAVATTQTSVAAKAANVSSTTATSIAHDVSHNLSDNSMGIIYARTLEPVTMHNHNTTPFASCPLCDSHNTLKRDFINQRLCLHCGHTEDFKTSLDALTGWNNIDFSVKTPPRFIPPYIDPPIATQRAPHAGESHQPNKH